MGSRWIFVAIPSVRLETGAGRWGLTEGRYEEDDLVHGAGGFYLASNRIAQNPSATSKNEAPICSGPILGA